MFAGVPNQSPLLRACLHGGGGPQVGEVTCGGSTRLTCKRDHTKIRDYMDRRVTPPKRVTSPTWGPLPPCKQALTMVLRSLLLVSYCFVGVVSVQRLFNPLYYVIG